MKSHKNIYRENGGESERKAREPNECSILPSDSFFFCLSRHSIDSGGL